MKQHPILYAASETAFSSNGIGVLQDAVRCRVTEELNGLYELEMTYPANGAFVNEISERSIIYAETSEDTGINPMQPFRVYRVVKSLTGNILIYAQHISYDLSGIPVSPFHLGDDWDYTGTASDALLAIQDNSAVTNPFTFSTDITSVREMDIKVPMSARSLLLGNENSVIKIFGGDFKFDGRDVYLLQKRGNDSGFAIRYGVNMTSLNQEENTEPFYTGIYPYYSDNDGTIEIDGKIIRTQDAHDFDRIRVVDLTSEFTQAPWYPSEVETKAREWLDKNGFGVPKICLDVGFAQLRKSEEYKDFQILEDVKLGDEVQVIFEKIGVSSTARVTKTVWDALEHRYVSIHLGDASQSIATTISNLQNTSVAKANETSASVIAAEERAKRRENAIKELNDVISSGLGMHKIVVSGKTYYSDNADLNDATYIITMNSGGFAYTYDWNNGNPTWQGGLGRDGNLIINRLSALKISATQLETDAIQSSNYDRTSGETYSNDGSFFDLGIGQLITPNFAITRDQAGFWSAIAKNINITNGGSIKAKEAEFDAISLSLSAPYSVKLSYTDPTSIPVTVNFTCQHIQLASNVVDIYVVADRSVPSDTELTVSMLYRDSRGHQHFPDIFQSKITILEGTTTERISAITSYDIDQIYGVGVVPSTIDYYPTGGSQYGMGINASLMPNNVNTCDLGKNFAGYRWLDLYIQNAPTVVSDRNEKNTIEKLPEEYSEMFDRLKAVRFKMNNGKSDRFHTGFIAQDVEEAMTEANITPKDFAGFVKSENANDGKVSYGLRYEEFIALCIDQIQKLKKRVEELEEKQKGE